MTERPPNRAVYTALIGGYEPLLEQLSAKTAGMPFICFTDDPKMTSETWQVRVIEPALVRDPSRSSRFPKILGEPLVPEYDETLWIDNRVLLTEDPDVVLDQMLADADIALLQHSHRESVMAEFDEVSRLGLDDPARIYEQLIHYAETKPHVLDLPPYWGAFIARRWTPDVRAVMRTWMDHVLRYSRRDQLSLCYALDGFPSVLALELDNFGSHWHTWVTDHRTLARDLTMRTDAFRTSIRAPLAELAEVNAEAASLRGDLATEKEHAARAAAQAATLAAEQSARIKRLRARVAGLRGELAGERERSARLEEELGQSTARRARRVAGAARRRMTGGGSPSG